MKADIYFSKIKIVGIFCLLLTIPFRSIGQPLCDAESCITVNLEEFIPGTGLQTIPGYQDIGETSLFCGYEDIINMGNTIGLLASLQGVGSNPVWSFNGTPSNDPFQPITFADTVTIDVATDLGSCSCIVILNPPPSPTANDITISLCDEDGTIEDYDLSMIDQNLITSPPNSTITYHNTQLDAENNIDPINTKTVVNGSVVHVRVEANGSSDCFSTSEITFSIGQNPSVAPASAISMLNCDSPQATIHANVDGGTPDYSYTWTTGDGTIVGAADLDSLTVSSAGTYTISLTDANGCMATGEVMIGENFTAPEFGAPSISANVGTEINCDISEIALTANATTPDGSTPTYEWTTTDGNISGDTSQVMTTVSAGGTYTITVTHPLTGCIITDNIEITEVDAPPTPEISPNSPTLTCSQTEITLTGSSTGVTPLTYEWSTGEATASINVTTPDTYTLTVTDGNGCDAISSTVVDESLTAPTVIITSPEIITCNNTTVQLDASDSEIIGMTANYLWTTSDGNIVSGNNSVQAVADAPGTYQVEITNVSNGCTASNTVTVTADIVEPVVNDDELQGCPEPGTNNASFDLTSANITAESGVNTTYYENSDLTSPISDPANYESPSGQVFASVEFDGNGCSSVATIDLSVLPIDIPNNLEEMYFQGVCSAQSITVAPPSGTPYTYTWSSPDGSGDVLEGEECTALDIVSDPTNFSLEISDDSGCLEVVPLSINLSAAAIDAQVFRSDNTNILFCNRNDFDTYQWGRESKTTLCAEPMDGETFQDVVVQDIDLDNYYYWVIVTEGSCTTKIYLTGSNNSPFGKLVVDPDAEYGDLTLQVNPNPNNGAFELIITGDEVRDLDVHLYDALGRNIYHRKAPKINGIESYYIAPPNLTQGLYFVRVTGNDDILLTEKIIVK